MFDSDLSYFLKRSAEEANAERQATSPEAAAAHRDLARRYRSKAADIEGEIGQRPLAVIVEFPGQAAR